MECIPSSMSAHLHFEGSKPTIEHLSVSSGNVQLLPVHQGDGIENQYPLPALSNGRSSNQQFPVPSLKLGSNDGSHHAFESKPRHHLHKPRSSKRLDPDRPYLVHPKYIEYRSRPRQEFGKDGKPIWPDHIEAAFQDALVHIKPMGRKKCSQRGKPYGRNMLIMEWIYRATGHKRERKQVSSHIQVLDRFLAGIPEWDRLIKPTDDDGTAEGHKFYSNSIEHMVNAQSKLRYEGDAAWDEELDEVDDSFISAAASGSKPSHPVERLSFEMWVSSPVDQERALHYYTGLKTDKMMPMPLEDLAGWRLSFPHLNKLVDRGTQLYNCDLILLKTSFKLMQEFPPRHSKLGIGLELKFPGSLYWSDPGEEADFREWNCTTYMYRKGVLIADPTREECQVSEHWKVRPFFQSKWWASTFTSLTEAEKVAQDSKDADAIEYANAQSHGFFRDLSVMQEISAVRLLGPWHPVQEKKRSRLAILLWKFSQAPADNVGTTTWQNLVAPPDRVTTNSPPPPDTDMDLPPLSMDSIVSPGVGSFHSNHFLSQHSMQYDVYPTGLEEELCQDGFMGLKPEQIHDFGHLQSSFNLTSSQDYSGVDPSLHDTFSLPRGNLQTTADDHHIINGSIFDPPHTQASTRSGLNRQIFGDIDNSQHSEDLPLSRFDVTTHQVLQEQLHAEDASQNASVPHSPPIKAEPSPQLSAMPDRNWSHHEDEIMRQVLAAQHQKSHQMQTHQPWSPSIDSHEEAHRNALLAASAVSDLGNATHPLQTPRSRHQFGEQRRHEDPYWVSPLPFRPTLQSYHSFPGMRADDHFERLHFGAQHHHDDGMSLSQRLPDIDGHGFIEHQLSAISAPEDFLHASSEVDGEGARGYARARSEPELSLAEATRAFGCIEQGSGAGSNDIGGLLQGHIRPSSLVPEDLHTGGSFVEVSMEDVQR